MRLTNTTKAASQQGVKALVYGKSGVGKTRLLATAPKPIIISAERGVLSLADKKLPVIELSSEHAYEDLLEVLELIRSGRFKKFETFGLDTISEIAEKILIEQKRVNKDARRAYGIVADMVLDIMRQFRDLPSTNVIFTAKRGHYTEDDEVVYYTKMPSRSLSEDIPYLFDEVFYYDYEFGSGTKPKRCLKTSDGFNYHAKDRSGALNTIEPPNLTKIFDKIASKRARTKKKGKQ